MKCVANVISVSKKLRLWDTVIGAQVLAAQPSSRKLFSVNRNLK